MMARPKHQLLNQRFGRLLVIEDKGSDKIDYYSLHSRIKRGWSIEDALTRPVSGSADGQLYAEGCKP